MDEGLSPRSPEPRRPLEAGGGAAERAASEPGSEALMMQILSTEHFSLLTSRSLVYNESFTRVGMFLTFLSMSLVAIALLANTLDETDQLPAVAAIVLGFDLVIGLATLIRVNTAYREDFQAVQAMARIRHGYVELAPEAARYLSTSTHDDVASVMAAYGGQPRSLLAGLGYGLSSSAGLAVLVVSLVAGAFVAVISLALGASSAVAVTLGAMAALATMALLVRWGYRSAVAEPRDLDVRFPAPGAVDGQPSTR